MKGTIRAVQGTLFFGVNFFSATFVCFLCTVPLSLHLLLKLLVSLVHWQNPHREMGEFPVPREKSPLLTVRIGPKAEPRQSH